jgi:hypothetical protein
LGPIFYYLVVVILVLNQLSEAHLFFSVLINFL